VPPHAQPRLRGFRCHPWCDTVVASRLHPLMSSRHLFASNQSIFQKFKLKARHTLQGNIFDEVSLLFECAALPWDRITKN
jgi:hypothetical protein